MPQRFSQVRQIALPEIPGISSLAWTPAGLYLLADNLPVLFCLETRHFNVNSRLSLDPQGRMELLPKPEKPDFEASALCEQDGRQVLLIFGSGSLSETREWQIRVDLARAEFERLPMGAFYQQLAQAVAGELNLEGACFCGEQLLLAQRGHLGQPHNFLVWSRAWQINSVQQLVLPRQPFVGISGLEYEPDKDRLWFTASTEATGSVYEDGQIGDSYLGWFEQISHRQQQAELVPDHLLNLTELDACFARQKIEAITLAPDRIYLGADNDSSQASLFVLDWAREIL